MANQSESAPLTGPDQGFTRYRLDADDRIVEVGGDWNRFAIANGAEGLSDHLVIGMPLRSFIAGDVTRMFVDAMLTRIRLTRIPHAIDYRCDSPGVKRFMQMKLECIGRDVTSEHRVIREVPIVRPVGFVSAIGSGGIYFRRCSMCNRLETPAGSLVEPEELMPQGGAAVPVIYGVCVDCRERVVAKLSL